MEREWFTDPNGFSGRHYFELYADRLTPERTKTEVSSILRLANPNNQTRFLDIPCGHGRHSIELGKRGYWVHGVDISADLLAIARRTVKTTGIETVTFYEGDMRTWCQTEAFDIALNLYVGFGYFKTDDEDDQVLQNIHTSLTPGGTLIVDQLNAARVIKEHAGRSQENTWTLTSGKTVRTCSIISSDQLYWVTTHTVDGTPRTFSLRLYTPEQLMQKLKCAGFAISAVYGDFDQSPLIPSSPRALFLARKL